MSKIKLFGLFFIVTLLFSCLTPFTWKSRLKKNVNPYPSTQREIENNRMIKYAIDNDLKVNPSSSGIYYLLEKEGDPNNAPARNSIVNIRYSGYLLNGDLAGDSGNDGKGVEELNLDGDIIRGWKESIGLLGGVGGKGLFIIPSHLAYGADGALGIPGNEPVVYDIELVDIVTR